MSDTELTAEQVATALNAYDGGKGYDGRTDWHVITDYDNTPYSVRSTSGPWVTMELWVARDLVAGWQAREELAWVDSVLARRPALDDCLTRAAKIERAINVAKRADQLEAELTALRATLPDWVDDAACHDAMCSYRAESGMPEASNAYQQLLAENYELKASIAALRAGAGPVWWPIETAPKDGTDVLMAWADGHLQIEALQPDDAERFWFEFAPMHWMPLPAPPQLADTGDSGEEGGSDE